MSGDGTLAFVLFTSMDLRSPAASGIFSQHTRCAIWAGSSLGGGGGHGNNLVQKARSGFRRHLEVELTGLNDRLDVRGDP